VPARTARATGRRRRPVSLLRTCLRSERGAAAVEFALVAPVLVFLLLGIVEFSKVMLVQSSLSAAARDGARAVTLGSTVGGAQATVLSAATSVPLAAGQVTVAGSCTGATSATTVTVTVTHTQPVLFGVLPGGGVVLTGKAVMRCGG
jgi:Flp pilus assembly protein TadG